MFRFKSLLLVCGCCLSSVTLWAQPNPNRFKLIVKPPNNGILIEQTTNLMTVAIANLAITNITVIPDPTGGTNSTTNMDITVVFTNVTVTATSPSGLSLTLLDDGAPPDKAAGDGIYSVNLIPALVPQPALQASNLTLQITVAGDNLNYTNSSGQQVTVPVTTNLNNFVYRIVARPLNDNFTNAFKIPPQGGLILATNNYASLQAGEPQHHSLATADASVWWKWSTPFDTNVLIDTGGSSFNPVLAVYTGTDIKQLTNVVSAADDTDNKLKAHVSFDAQAGVTYRIAVAGQDTNGVGNLRLRVAPGAPVDTFPPTAAFTSPKDGALFTTNLVAFAGLASEGQSYESGVAQVFLIVNKGSPVLMNGTTTWSGSLTLPPGTNQVGVYAVDFDGNKGTPVPLTVIYMNPTNDSFTSAIQLTDASGIISAINGRATKEPGEPNHAGNEGGHSIWYWFRAPTDGVLWLSTTNSNFDTLLAAYLGESVSNLTAIASNDDVAPGIQTSQLAAFVYSNQVCYLAVDGYGGVSGAIRLSYVFWPQSPPTLARLSFNYSPGGSVLPAPAYYPINSTVVLRATPARNYLFAQWEGSVAATNNPLTLTMNGDKTLTARFRYLNYTEDFEAGALSRLPWTTPSGAPWFVQAEEASGGLYAARSGILGDSQESTLQLVTHTLAGSGAFDLRVSSEVNFDFLEFWLNGVRLKQWSGDVSWRTFYFDVPAGNNTFLWRYVKDESFSEGLDAAFIDNLSLPQGDLAPTLTLTPAANGLLSFQVQGKLDQNYVIQASADLKNWTNISTNSSADGLIQFVDPQAPNYPARFYRATTP